MPTRQEQLAKLAAAIPVANQRAAKAAEATRAMQLQSAIAQAPASLTPPQIQQAGAAAAAEKAAIEGQAAQAAVKQQGQVQGLQGVEHQRTLGEQVAGAREAGENTLHKGEMDLAKRQLTRDTSNEMSKIAWAIQSTKNESDFALKKQSAEQAHQRNLKVNQVVYNRVLSMIENANQRGEQEKDQEHFKKLYELKSFYEKKMRDEQAEMANSMAAWQAGGQMVGTVVGAVVGPGGAMAGGALGGGAGSLIGGQTV